MGRSGRLRALFAFTASAAALWAALAAATPSADEDAVEVVASRSGFRPGSLRARKGETVRLLLRTSDEEHCFAIDAFRIEKRIQPGKTTNLDLTPDKLGTFDYYCCLESGEAADAQRGRLIVTE